MGYESSAGQIIGRIVRWTIALILLLFLLSVLWVIVYKFVNPPTTALMLRDQFAGHSPKQTWRPLSQIDQNMPRAVITAEDARFCSHNGFDVDGIMHAFRKNLEGKKLRGGSTVSQQTAKNVFLWPNRSWVRKGLEVYFTGLIEMIWGKRRIMEVYLNVVETGINTFGVEEAAKRYYNHSADTLSRREAARIAAILPQPIKREAKNPTGYTRRYARNIERWIRVVRDEKLDACLAK
jgi:monofunctional biosynthetic peptidoglycan transglycosylase